jgi:hypothetical protein
MPQDYTRKDRSFLDVGKEYTLLPFKGITGA